MQDQAFEQQGPSDVPEESDGPSTNRFDRRLIVAIAVVILATAFLIFRSLDAASAVYMEVDEAVAAADELGDRRIRIGGVVVPGSIDQHGDGLDIDFTVQDESGSITLPVSYRGVPPDIFGDRATVFVEGYYQSGVFEANVLLTRHPDTMEELRGSEIPDSYRTSS